MGGRGRGGSSRGGGRGGYVYHSATKLPEDRDAQEGRQPNLLSVGGPPRIGTYSDRGRRRGGSGPPRGSTNRGRGGSAPNRTQSRDGNPVRRYDAGRDPRQADTYRPAQDAYPRANLPLRPPAQAPVAPRWNTEAHAGPSRSPASYNPPSPMHTRFDNNSGSHHRRNLSGDQDYNPPSPVQPQSYDELQDDVKPIIDIHSPPRQPSPTPPSLPVALARSPPPPATRLDPEAEAMRKMHRFKPGPVNKSGSGSGSSRPSASTNGDVKPTRHQLEEHTPQPPVDDLSRPSGVLALRWDDMPLAARGPPSSARRQAREKVVETHTVKLASQGRQLVTGGVRWRSDGCCFDWIRRPPSARTAQQDTAPSSAAGTRPVRAHSARINEERKPPVAGFGVDPGPIRDPAPATISQLSRRSPSATVQISVVTKSESARARKRRKTFTAPEDIAPFRPLNIPTAVWNAMSQKKRKSARFQAARAEFPDLAELSPKEFKRELKRRRLEKARTPEEESIRFSSGASSDSASSVDEPIAKRKKSISTASAQKPSVTPSRQVHLPTPTPSDPDLVALARITELETSLKAKVTDVDRWTKMQQDYPELRTKTQGQIDGLQKEIADIFDEIRRLKGQE